MKAARQSERRRTRKALFYCYGLGMSLEEAGWRLGLKPESVAKLLKKAAMPAREYEKKGA